MPDKKESIWIRLIESIPSKHRLPVIMFIVIESIFTAIIISIKQTSTNDVNDSAFKIFIALISAMVIIALYFLHRFFDKSESNNEDTKDNIGKIINFKDWTGRNPYIVVKCRSTEKDDVKIIAELFKKSKDESRWITDTEVELTYDGDGEYKVHTSEIAKQLNTKESPYKLYCKVLKDDDILKEYYYKLLSNGNTIITGKGEIDENNNYWRIYFLVNDQPPHSDMKGLYEINHSIGNDIHE